MDGFGLHPRLAADSHLLTDLPLCQLRRMRDARWLWLLLVPRLADRRELTDLDAAQQTQLMREVDLSSHLLLQVAKPTKLNTAALGNIVEQLRPCRRAPCRRRRMAGANLARGTGRKPRRHVLGGRAPAVA